MKNRLILIFALLLFSSHDMYLKPDRYFLQPDTWSSISLFNGTFDKSENAIARNRMKDVSLLGNGVRSAVDSTQWSDKDSTAVLRFKTGEAGTWVAGMSTHPSTIEMAAADFNSYLEHDGVTDMLAWREENGALEQDAVEEYSKHVKTIFQVGERTSGDWNTVLGYPIEFVPMENPYDLHPGHRLTVQLLWQGQPLPGQLVYAGSESADAAQAHSHAEGTDPGHAHAAGEAGHQHTEGAALRTDAEGKVQVDLSGEGVWYLRTIHLIPSAKPGLTHESNWATLTFAVGSGHAHTHEDAAHTHDGTTHTHDGTAHTHDSEEGIPSWAYWLGSLLLVAGLFLWFKRRS